MKEDFLYYLWENRLLKGELHTVEGEKVEVINTGYRNSDSGPDFLEGTVRIGDTVWAGHIEIHIKTSDWNRHGHQTDKAYQNVVLHVVHENDARVNDIPTMELKGQYDEALYHNYERFMMTKNRLACANSLNQVQAFTRYSWLERMAVERLEKKAENTNKILASNNFDWEDALYKLLMRYLGLKVNNEAFEYLAHILPYKTLLKHADNLLQTEAMLYGCAGFLEDDFTEDYPLLLKREFAVMRAKFDLLTMPAERWKFMRMHPSNFPTIRLAQMAQLIHKNGCLFSKVKAAKDTAEVKALFDVEASEYWETHWRLGVTAETKPKHLGNATADILIINAVAPLLFCYGKLHKDESVCETAMHFLEETEAEDNTVIRHFKSCGITAENAMQTQALLHLYSYFCKRKRCLECRIGNVLLHKTNPLS